MLNVNISEDMARKIIKDLSVVQSSESTFSHNDNVPLCERQDAAISVFERQRIIFLLQQSLSKQVGPSHA